MMDAKEAAEIAKSARVNEILYLIAKNAIAGHFKVSVPNHDLEGGVYQRLEEMGYKMSKCLRDKTWGSWEV